MSIHERRKAVREACRRLDQLRPDVPLDAGTFLAALAEVSKANRAFEAERRAVRPRRAKRTRPP
jgi:hypothetical protein